MRNIKNRFIATGIATALLALPISQANAQKFETSNGTLLVTGRVVATPCEVDNPEPIQVDLGHNISLVNLEKNGHSPFKTVTLKLTNCTLHLDDSMAGATATPGYNNLPQDVKQAKLSFTGVKDKDDDMLYQNIAAKPAKHVAVGLYDMTQTIVAPNTGITSPFPLNSDIVNVQFLIAAVNSKKGLPYDIAPGDVEANINYTINYD